MKQPLKLPVDNTRTQIMEYLLNTESTAIDMARYFGMNESAVRRHLDVLENMGLVEHQFKKASMGRPKKIYQLTSRGSDVFPNKSGFMVSFLSRELNKRLGPEEMEEVVESLAQAIKERILDVPVKDDIDDLLKNMVDVFNDLGLYCSLEKADGSYYITYRNCAFREVSPEFSVWMCNAHRKVFRDVLGDISVEQVRSILNGDTYCKQRIIINGDGQNEKRDNKDR